MSHHTVTTQSLCFTTQFSPHSYHTIFVSPYSYQTIFMTHHTVTTQSLCFTTVTTQSLCLTTQLPHNLYVSPHSYHTIFMSHHTVTIQNTTYFQWLSHSNFTSITHTKIPYPKLPNCRDLCTPKFSGLTNTSFLCCSSHDKYAGFTNSKAESSYSWTQSLSSKLHI